MHKGQIQPSGDVVAGEGGGRFVGLVREVKGLDFDVDEVEVVEEETMIKSGDSSLSSFTLSFPFPFFVTNSFCPNSCSSSESS